MHVALHLFAHNPEPIMTPILGANLDRTKTCQYFTYWGSGILPPLSVPVPCCIVRARLGCRGHSLLESPEAPTGAWVLRVTPTSATISPAPTPCSRPSPGPSLIPSTSTSPSPNPSPGHNPIPSPSPSSGSSPCPSPSCSPSCSLNPTPVPLSLVLPVASTLYPYL